MRPTWRGRRVLPSLRADREMRRLHLYLEDIIEVLESGSDCSRSPRGVGVVERCLRGGGRLLKVVAVSSETRWNGEEVWLVVHVGELHGR